MMCAHKDHGRRKKMQVMLALIMKKTMFGITLDQRQEASTHATNESGHQSDPNAAPPKAHLGC
jgi:hypothetical protein